MVQRRNLFTYICVIIAPLVFIWCHLFFKRRTVNGYSRWIPNFMVKTWNETPFAMVEEKLWAGRPSIFQESQTSDKKSEGNWSIPPFRICRVLLKHPPDRNRVTFIGWTEQSACARWKKALEANWYGSTASAFSIPLKNSWHLRKLSQQPTLRTGSGRWLVRWGPLLRI